jgi:hypothetical protein
MTHLGRGGVPERDRVRAAARLAGRLGGKYLIICALSYNPP